MENDPNQKTWEEIQDHGVLECIQNWDDYVSAYRINAGRADDFLADCPNLWSKNTILTTHRLLFQNIAPWAGEPSTRQEMIASIPGSPPELRDFEFHLLEAQMEILESEAITTTAKIRMAAFHHRRLLCMHPFRDGNGRATRLLLSKQLEKITGKTGPLACSKSDYIETLEAAHPAGNLAPLSNLLHQSLLGQPDPAKFLPVPFRINSLQLQPRHPEDALNDSFREMPNVIRSTKTPEKVSWLKRIHWSEIEQLCSAKPGKNLERVKSLWQENRSNPFSPRELADFLDRLEKMHPWTQPTGLLRRPQGTSWKPVLSKLLEPWHAVHPQKPIHGPNQEI